MFFNYDSIIIILPIYQVQTQYLMTSQSTSHIEYLIPIYNPMLAFDFLSLASSTGLVLCNKYIYGGGLLL